MRTGAFLLGLFALINGCGGGSSSPSSTEPAVPEPQMPVPQMPVPERPQTPVPAQDSLFQLSFPPARSRTESTSISIAGQLVEGTQADSVRASTGDQETALVQSADGEWRGELPLASGENTLTITVTPRAGTNAGEDQSSELATVSQGVLLGYPRNLAVIEDRAYTLDRGRFSVLGLIEIDLATGIGARVTLDPSIVPPKQLLGQVNGELLIRDSSDSFRLLNLSRGTSQQVFSQSRRTPDRPALLALDESTNQVYATVGNQIFSANIGGALPVALTEGAGFESVGAGNFLGLDRFDQSLIFQPFATSTDNSRPLVTINVQTGDRAERDIRCSACPFSATAALAEPTGLVLSDPLGQLFRLEGETLSAASLLSVPEDQASIDALVARGNQWLALDTGRGNLFSVNPEDGSRASVLSATNGAGPPNPAWHGLIYNDSRDELLGISYLGAQSVDSSNGDRSENTAIEFESVSAGPNFIALPPLAGGLALEDGGNDLLFARVSLIAEGSTDIVRLNLNTGESASLATINSRAQGTVLPKPPSVVIDASRQLAWFFDVDEDRSLSRIDLASGSITRLGLSVTDRPLYSVLADPVNGRLLFATIEANADSNRLDIIALNHDGQMPETLASLAVDPDATEVFDPKIQMALSPSGDTLYVPLPKTERVAAINLARGEGQLLGGTLSAAPERQFVRFTTGLSVAAAPDGRVFLVNGDSGIKAIDPGSESQVVLSR